MRSEGYSIWYVSVCLSFCLLPRFLRRVNKTAILMDSSLHWFHFKEGDFHITTAFKSYGVKSKGTNLYAN